MLSTQFCQLLNKASEIVLRKSTKWPQNSNFSSFFFIFLIFISILNKLGKQNWFLCLRINWNPLETLTERIFYCFFVVFIGFKVLRMSFWVTNLKVWIVPWRTMKWFERWWQIGVPVIKKSKKLEYSMKNE